MFPQENVLNIFTVCYKKVHYAVCLETLWHFINVQSRHVKPTVFKRWSSFICSISPLFIFLPHAPPPKSLQYFIPSSFLCSNSSVSSFLSIHLFHNPPAYFFFCAHSRHWICPSHIPSAPLLSCLNGGLITEPLLCRSAWIALSLPSYLLTSSHIFIHLSRRSSPPVSRSAYFSHTHSLCSPFSFSRGGSGKLWRVQSPGRGSEEHWGWQLLVHEQTAGRHPGKHVCTCPLRRCRLSRNKLWWKYPQFYTFVPTHGRCSASCWLPPLCSLSILLFPLPLFLSSRLVV